MFSSRSSQMNVHGGGLKVQDSGSVAPQWVLHNDPDTELHLALSRQFTPLTERAYTPLPPFSELPCPSDSEHPSHYRTSSYPSSSAERRAQRNLQRDPSWIPRPPNAFIIFRAEYSRKHAQIEKDSEAPADKTLSKRAGEAWKTLSEPEKEPYKLLAEQERVEHARKHPDYKYRPRRRVDGVQKASGGSVSRREQVASFMRRAASRSSASESEYSSDYRSSESPASIASSSSPEPPSTPFRDESPSNDSHHDSRSSSQPPPQGMMSDDQLRHPLSFLSPSSCASTPCIGSQPPTSLERKLRSMTDIRSPYTALDYLVLPRGDANPEDKYLSLNLFDESSSSMMKEELTSNRLLFEESINPGAEVGPIETCPPPSSYGLDFNNPGLSPTSPLYQRRRRAATTSGALPSPLTVVTSSLGDWNTCRDGYVKLSPGLGSYSYSPRRSSMPPPFSSLAPGTAPWDDSQTSTLDSLSIPGTDMDLDRTPRYSDFPRDIQGAYIPPPNSTTCGPVEFMAQSSATTGEAGGSGMSTNAYDGASADFESYAIGLSELGIEPVIWNMSPFAELDVNDFLYVGRGP
ncbi:hypothetical protein AcV5_005668 [Taiwanofungus camphoratus]|nr:hypothetical protein AcV5_005668 [Antrodia cinnamomea]